MVVMVQYTSYFLTDDVCVKNPCQVLVLMKMVMTLLMKTVMRIYLMVVTPPVLTLIAPSSHILVDLQIFKVFLQLAYIQCCRKSKGVKKVSYSVRFAKYGGLVELTE